MSRRDGRNGRHFAAVVFKVDRQGNDVEIYRSARAAAQANYANHHAILDRCHNRIKNPYELFGGYTFRFEEPPKRKRGR